MHTKELLLLYLAYGHSFNILVEIHLKHNNLLGTIPSTLLKKNTHTHKGGQ
jgi:hypothetical protein